jgi:HEAT repeat protein
MCWAYSGSTEKLRDLVTRMLAGEEVIVPCARFDPAKVAEYKAMLHEKKAPLWRMKGSLKIADYEACMREKAKYVVGLGALGPEAVPGFVKALTDANPATRAKAAEELGQIGPEAKPAIDPLVRTLADAEAGVRIKAAEAVLNIEPAHKSALPVLLESLKDEKLRGTVVDVLGRQGVKVKAAVPALVDTLKDRAAAIRVKAAEALALIEPGTTAAVPTLVELLKDADKAVRIKSADLLGGLGPAAKPAVAPLIEAVKDPDAEVRAKAAETLGKVGPAAVPGLIAAVKDKDVNVRLGALDALAACGGHAAPAIPTLIEIIKEPVPAVRSRAVDILKPFGRAAAPAVPVLVEMLKGDRESKIKAAELLAEIGPVGKSAVPNLTANTRADTSGTVRRTSAEALGRMGKAAAEAVPTLAEMLNHEVNKARPEVRLTIAEALARIGPDSRPALPAIEKLLTEPQNELRMKGAEVFGRLRPFDGGPVVELFEDHTALLSGQLYVEEGQIHAEGRDRYSGEASIRVTPNQRYNPGVAGWNFPIVEKPGPGQYRYLRFAWKKVGGRGIMIQLATTNRGWENRYVGGRNVHGWAAIQVDARLPADWVVVTRDLFKDFGAIQITGMALTAMDGNGALYDHMYLGRTIEDLDRINVKKHK